MEGSSKFETENITKLLLSLAPPVMLSQLIQALYNIVDSFFIGRYASAGLTALSIIYPVQLLFIAVAVGTGVGCNTLIAKYNGKNMPAAARNIRQTGVALELINWAVLVLLLLIFLKPYIAASTSTAAVRKMALDYGMITGIGSGGLFLESVFSKIHQAEGNMKRPMAAQIAGAVLNIALDPVLIFGFDMGVRGAAAATVAGQVLAAVIVFGRAFQGLASPANVRKYGGSVYRAGLPTIITESLFTVYIVCMNFILASFSDEAVTVLGLYYKLQTFFFIPLFGLQTCLVPVVSYNYAAGKYARCSRVMKTSAAFGCLGMGAGTVLFELIPGPLLRIFTDSETILSIGIPAFRIIGASFVMATFVILTAAFFQAIEKQRESITITVLRQIFLLIPLAYVLSKFGLTSFWFAFPLAELLTLLYALYLYKARYLNVVREGR